MASAVTAGALVRDTLGDKYESDATGNAETSEFFHDMILVQSEREKQVLTNVVADFFSMPEPVPSKTPSVGNISLATFSSPTTETNLYDLKIINRIS